MITTWKNIFDQTCCNTEKAGQLPELLDYHLSTMESEDFVVDTEDLRIPVAHLDYGGSEGIYLTLHVFDKERGMMRIGTFKTLEASEDAMEIMALLYGRFINALYKWLEEV